MADIRHQKKGTGERSNRFAPQIEPPKQIFPISFLSLRPALIWQRRWVFVGQLV
jgi:hypothetical protein